MLVDSKTSSLAIAVPGHSRCSKIEKTSGPKSRGLGGGHFLYICRQDNSNGFSSKVGQGKALGGVFVCPAITGPQKIG
jgi:hypothetical protein